MSQCISDPPEKQTPAPAPTKKLRTHLSGIGVVSLLVMVGLSLLLFSGQILFNLGQVWANSASTPILARKIQASPTLSHPTMTSATNQTPTVTPTPTLPFFAPNTAATTAPPLQLPAAHSILYQNHTHIYLVSTTDNTITSLYTPDYAYNEAVRPLLTPTGQLIYTGSQSVWMTDIFDQQPVQIAQFGPDTSITSLALSQDGKTFAWSTAPLDGNGQITIYAGSLTSPQVVWQQSALQCPCFRIFSFLDNDGATNNTLLLSDDLGSSEAVQYGLWSLDISTPGAQPQAIMNENPQPQQGPLAFAPYSNILLYSANEQVAPVPTDNSVPADVAALSYPNSLSLATLDGTPLSLGAPLEVLAPQAQKANNALYRWVTTPTFSPDGQTLTYVEFSSDSQDPYDRHSAVYTMQVTVTDTGLQVGHPQLVASSTSRLLELGPWLNSHVVTLYGDGTLYAMDVQTGSATAVVSTGGYARILAVVGTGQT